MATCHQAGALAFDVSRVSRTSCCSAGPPAVPLPPASAAPPSPGAVTGKWRTGRHQVLIWEAGRGSQG